MIKDEYSETILNDEAYLPSLLNAIHEAINSIDLETYIFAEDEVGKKVAEALCQAANRGVKIRVLVDGIGTLSWGGEITQQLEKAGVKTKIFHPLPWKISHWRHSTLPSSSSTIRRMIHLLARINSRNHRKVCIIDKKIIFLGSANISNHLLNKPPTAILWRETSIKLEDINTEDVQYAFDKAWGMVSFKKRLRTSFKKIHPESIFQLNYSWRRRRKQYKSFLARITHCQKRIWVTNAYFIPERKFLKKIIKASKHGVDVRILLPQKSDVLMIPLASATFYALLLKNKIAIYEYLPTILHAKVSILDDWYSIGSSNLNNRSLMHDLEVNVTIKSDESKNIIMQQFLTDLKNSQQIELSDAYKQPLYKKILGYFILLIRYWS